MRQKTVFGFCFSCLLLLPPAYWFDAALRAGSGVKVISVRRFFDLPPTVVLFANGFDAPMPFA